MPEPQYFRRRFDAKAICMRAMLDPDQLPAIIALRPNLVSDRDENGATALHYAVASGNVSTVKLLKDLGFDPEVSDNRGFTPLSMAIDQQSEAMIRVLRCNPR